MALVAHGAEGVSAVGGGDGFEHFGRSTAHVVNLDPLRTGKRYQQVLVVRCAKHVGGHGTGFGAPFQGLAYQINRHQFVAVLHGAVDRGAFGVNPQMAGGFPGGNALGKGHIGAIPMVDINVV